MEAQRTDSGETVQISCDYLWGCSGYYRYEEGYTPEFEGAERFAGQVVHPQHWPEDLDYAGKRVVVIGSGATAVTLVPGDGRAGRPGHDAAALADLHRLAARRGPARQPPAPRAPRALRLLDRALEERPPAELRLPALPPSSRGDQADDPQGRAALPAARL